jgi:hypothetical protein
MVASCLVTSDSKEKSKKPSANDYAKANPIGLQQLLVKRGLFLNFSDRTLSKNSGSAGYERHLNYFIGRRLL